MLTEFLQLVRLTAADAESYGPYLSEWILDAGNPHLQWLYLKDREHALRSICASLAYERSELWVGNVTALVASGRTIGGFVAFPGHELAARRRADVAMLIRSTESEKRAELRRRLELGRDLYLPVEPDHRFLSKIGILPPYRGRGIGAWLLDAFIASSWKEGYEHIRLDVSTEHPSTVRLYESRGFKAVGSRALEPLNVEYVAMVLARRT